MLVLLDVVAQGFKARTGEAEARQPREFEARLVCVASSRPGKHRLCLKIIMIIVTIIIPTHTRHRVFLLEREISSLAPKVSADL